MSVAKTFRKSDKTISVWHLSSSVTDFEKVKSAKSGQVRLVSTVTKVEKLRRWKLRIRKLRNKQIIFDFSDFLKINFLFEFFFFCCKHKSFCTFLLKPKPKYKISVSKSFWLKIKSSEILNIKFAHFPSYLRKKLWSGLEFRKTLYFNILC